jgi:uncharacterized membrane protein
MGGMVVSLALMAVFDVGLSILIFYVLRSQGASETVAYLGASGGPIVGMLVSWLRTRQVGGVSIIILVFLVISALVSLIGGGGRILLLKDSVLTGGFGLVTLVSAIPIFPTPLMFYFGLKFATDGSRAGVDAWYDLWRKYREFRAGQYLINTVWGVSFVVEALVKAAFTFTVPYNTAYTINQVLPLLVLAGVLVWTISYGRRQGKRAMARIAAAQSAAKAQAAPPAGTGTSV